MPANTATMGMTVTPRLRITGRVTLRTGEPAVGAQVRAVTPLGIGIPEAPRQLEAQATVDAAGEYQLEMEDTSSLLLTVSLEGHGREGRVLFDESPWARGRAQPVRELREDFVLGEAAILAGIVTDPSGAPIAGATVTAARHGESGLPADYGLTLNLAERFEAVTGEDGAFSFDDAPEGDYVVMASAIDYVSTRIDVVAPAEAVSLVLDKSGASVSGVVFRKETGKPVEGASVRIEATDPPDIRLAKGLRWLFPVTTDATGEFRFDGLPVGSYSLLAIADGLAMWEGEGAPKEFELSAGQVLTDQHLIMYGGSTVRGIVRDQATGEPLEGVTVDNNPWGHSGRQDVVSDVTDENGVFQLSGLYCDRVELRVAKTGYKLAGAHQLRQRVPVDIDPEQGGATADIEMVAVLTVSGVVKRADGGDVTSGKARWSPSGVGIHESVELGNGGTFQFEVFPRAAGVVVAEVPDFPETGSGLIQVLETDVQDVEVILPIPGTVRGRVLDPDGRPVEGAEVYLVLQVNQRPGLSNPRYKILSDTSGAYSFSRLTPAEGELVARKEGYTDSAKTVVLVTSGQTTRNVDLRLHTAHFLSGTLVDMEDNPVPSVEVRATDAGGRELGTRVFSGDQGQFALKGLPEGWVNVQIVHRTAGFFTFRNEKVDRDGVVFRIDPLRNDRPDQGKGELVMLLGSVVDDTTGLPVDGIRVEVNPAYASSYPVTLDDEVAGLFRIVNLHRAVSPSFTIQAPGRAPLEVKSYKVSGDDPVVRDVFRLKPGGRIIGRTIGEDGNPLEGVEVANMGTSRSYPPPITPVFATAVSDAEGRFELENVQDGRNTLHFLPRGGLPDLRRQVIVTDGRTIDMGDVVIDAGRRVRVRVVSTPGRTPVAGQIVRIEEIGTRPARSESKATDADGLVVFEGLRREQHVVELVDYGLECRLWDSTRKEWTVEFPVGSGTLKGRIRSAAYPLPANLEYSIQWEGNRIQSVYSGGRQSDPEGNFVRERMAGGPWKVRINVQAAHRRLYFRKEVQVAGTGVTEHEFVLGDGALVGRVVNARGSPVGRAVVRWEQATESSMAYESADSRIWTLHDGTFRFGPLEEGVYNLTAEAPDGGRGKLEGVSVPLTGESTVAVITLTGEDCDGSLVSTVYDDKTGEALPGASCTLVRVESGEPFRYASFREMDGVLRIDCLPAGTYMVTVGMEGYSQASHLVSIAEGGVEEITDVLHEAGSMLWTLRDAQGRPLAGVPCTLTPNDPASLESVRRGTTDEYGYFRISGLWPGLYTARADVGAGRTLVRDFLVQVGMSTMEESRAEP